MDNTKDGGSVNKPPVFDRTNYDYWKAKMVAFLKSIDNKTWKAVIKGWKHHVVTAQDYTTSLKPEADWSKDDDNETLINDNKLNYIFNGVDKNVFRLINYIEAKEVWEILKTALKCVCLGCKFLQLSFRS